MAPDLVPRLAKGGWLILSGILMDRQPGLRRPIGNSGFVCGTGFGLAIGQLNHHAAIGSRHNAAIMGWTVSQQDQTRAKRLETLRSAMAAAGFDGWIIGREDMYQGEEVLAGDERLAYLSGFTGSAGFCGGAWRSGRVVEAMAGIVCKCPRKPPGRLGLQHDLDVKCQDWLKTAGLASGAIIAIDGRLVTVVGFRRFEKSVLPRVERLFVTMKTCLISNGMIVRLYRRRRAGRCPLKMPVSQLPKRAMIFRLS